MNLPCVVGALDPEADDEDLESNEDKAPQNPLRVWDGASKDSEACIGD